MAVTVKVGMVFDAADARSGATDHGPWFMVTAKAEKGSDQIQLFAHGDNAIEAKKWDTVKVKSIEDVKRTARQYKGQWMPSISASVVFEEGPKKKPYETADGFLEAPPDDLDDLPFN